MKVFLDTSVLVAAVLANHDAHQRAFAVLARVHSGKDEGIVAGHSLAEMYSVLTKIPPPFRHTPEQALLSIEENVVNYFSVSALTGNEYAALIRESTVAGIQGGTVYDALLLKSATKATAEQIFTLNLKHFQAVATDAMRPSLAMP